MKNMKRKDDVNLKMDIIQNLEVIVNKILTDSKLRNI